MPRVPGRHPAPGPAQAAPDGRPRGRGASGPGDARPDADLRAGRGIGAAAGGLVLLVLLVGLVALLVRERWAPLQSLDDTVSARAERLVEASPALLSAARVVTHLGDPLLVTLASLAMVAGLVATGRRRMALYVVVARFGAAVLSTGLKEVVGRARPVFDVPVASAFGQSFPSGHALGGSAFWLTTAVVLIALGRSSRAWLGLAVVVSLLVAASRVLLGVHYLSDVLAGLVLGAGWTLVCTSLFRVWHAEERGEPVGVEQALEPERDR